MRCITKQGTEKPQLLAALCIESESEAMNPVVELYSWFNENKDNFLVSCNNFEFKDSGRGSACVNLETEMYIISVCAWDHACCLDIQVMEVRSEESRFPHMGDCDSIDQFKSHLKDFSVWLKGESSENA